MESPRHRVAWIVLGALALLLFAGLAALSAAWRPLSSPDRVRPWAAASYDEVVRGPVQPRPTLASHPAPPLPVAVKGSRAKLTIEDPLSGFTDQDAMARVTAGPTLEATLPGSTVEVSLLAWSSPKSGADGWRDPEDGAALDPKLVEAIREEIGREPTERALTFVVEARGGPVRFLGPKLLDRRTRAALTSGSSWSVHGTLCLAMFDDPLLHRTPLLLAVPIAYGEPRAGLLGSAPGDRADLDDLARVEMVYAGRGSLRSTGTRQNPNTNETTSTVEWDPAPAHDSQLTVMTCWPPPASAFLQVRPEGSTRWSGPHGRGGLIHGSGLRDAADRYEVRCFPEGALVLFEVPPLDVLPEVRNLFDVPLGSFRARDIWHLRDQLVHALQAESGSLGFLELPDDVFPLEREGLDASMLIEELAALSGQTIGFDPVECRFTNERPGRLARAWQMLKGR